MIENNEKEKNLKYDNHIYDNKMVMYPFNRRRTQRNTSILFMIVGALLMISTPIIRISNSITLSGFIAGLLVFFLGFLYFLDVQ